MLPAIAPIHAAQRQEQLNSAYDALAKTQGLLPIKVTPFYQKKVDAEVAALSHFHGPLARTVYPSEERIALRAPGEVADWVDDRSNMPGDTQGVFIQKYANRVLFTPTPVCAAHCLYCFRQDVLSGQKAAPRQSLDAQLDILSRHLRAHPEISEVILSGGDPLALSLEELARIFDALARIPSVTDIRMHTRMPVFSPAALKQEEKLALLARHKVRVVMHVVHPYEVCDEVATLITRMHEKGIRLYNHFPMLRHVNDHADVLLALMTRLEKLHVRTLSVYVPEPVFYSAAYRVRYDRMCAIIDDVILRAPLWLSAFRFCLDSPHGKVRREHLKMRGRDSDMLVFMREGQRIEYRDFPAEMDTPGDIRQMLWRGIAP